jgi:hypothetical protein
MPRPPGLGVADTDEQRDWVLAFGRIYRDEVFAVAGEAARWMRHLPRADLNFHPFRRDQMPSPVLWLGIRPSGIDAGPEQMEI